MSRERSQRPATRSSARTPEAGPERRPGASPHGLPQPSIWPVTVALGLTLLLGGIPTNALVALGGVVLFALGVGGWVRELLVGPGAEPAPQAGESPARQAGQEERLSHARGRGNPPPAKERGEETR